MNNGVFSDWEEVGYGESVKHWFQIRGLMNGNNIAVSVHIEGRKKKFNLYLLSLQGTEVECEIDSFSYTHKDHVLQLMFYNSDKTIVKHVVKYGD